MRHPVVSSVQKNDCTISSDFSFFKYFSHFRRWLTLMLSQEFPLPDVLRIWDSLLSDETRSDFLIDVCTAMILVTKDQIMVNDFADNMKLLQVS